MINHILSDDANNPHQDAIFLIGDDNKSTLSNDAWVVIMSFVPSPFCSIQAHPVQAIDKQVDGTMSPCNALIASTSQYHNRMFNDEQEDHRAFESIKRIREWNQFRSMCSSMYHACRVSVLHVDLSSLFVRDMIQINQATYSIIPAGFKRSFYESTFQKRLFPKRKELLTYDSVVMGEIMKRQEKWCGLFVRGFPCGFSNVKSLILDGWYFIQQSEVEQVCEKLKHLTQLSIVKCKRVKNLDLSLVPTLKHLRLHVNQIKLRINMTRQRHQSGRYFEIGCVGGWDFFFKTMDQYGFSDSFYYHYFIQDVKEILEFRLRVPKETICLIFAGKQLENERRLSDYCVTKESTLYIYIRK